MGRHVGRHVDRRFYEPMILHALRNGEPTVIAQTTDFVEKLWQCDRYVAIGNTKDYRFTLIKFKSEEDAKNFKEVIVEMSRALGKLPLADYEEWSPFFIAKQRQLLKTMLSYYDNAKVVCWIGSVREKVLEEIKTF